MPALKRTLQLSGQVKLLPIRRNGFYAHGLPKDLPLRYWLRTLALELCLRARLFFKGAIRGVASRPGA